MAHGHLEMLKIHINIFIYIFALCGEDVFAALSAMPASYHVFVRVSRLLNACLGVVGR